MSDQHRCTVEFCRGEAGGYVSGSQRRTKYAPETETGATDPPLSKGTKTLGQFVKFLLIP